MEYGPKDDLDRLNSLVLVLWAPNDGLAGPGEVLLPLNGDDLRALAIGLLEPTERHMVLKVS